MDWTTAEFVCFCSLSSLLLVSASLDCFPCSDVRALLWVKGWQKIRFTFIPHCTRMCHLLLSAVHDLFDTSVHFSFIIISLIFLLFLLPDTFYFLNVADKYPEYFRWGLWHPGRERFLHRLCAQRPLHHRGLCRIHPGIFRRAADPWAPSVRRSLMRAEDEPITLKKACRLVCRRQSIMIERGNPLLKQEKTKHVHLTTLRVPTLNWHMIDRSNPLLKHTENVPDGCQTRSFHGSISFNVGEETLRDRSGQPVADHDGSNHEQTMLSEVNMDFRIPGLPHSVVEHVQSTSVRELIQKIENHPDRHARQQDPRENPAYNPFGTTTK